MRTEGLLVVTGWVLTFTFGVEDLLTMEPCWSNPRPAAEGNEKAYSTGQANIKKANEISKLYR